MYVLATSVNLILFLFVVRCLIGEQPPDEGGITVSDNWRQQPKQHHKSGKHISHIVFVYMAGVL